MSDVVLKVNFQPFLLLLDLYGAVDDENAAAVFEGGQVQIRLTKVAAGMWETLEATGTKQALKQRREASIAAKEESERVKVERKREKRIEDGREALRKQVSVILSHLLREAVSSNYYNYIRWIWKSRSDHGWMA